MGKETRVASRGLAAGCESAVRWDISTLSEHITLVKEWSALKVINHTDRLPPHNNRDIKTIMQSHDGMLEVRRSDVCIAAK